MSEGRRKKVLKVQCSIKPPCLFIQVSVTSTFFYSCKQWYFITMRPFSSTPQPLVVNMKLDAFLPVLPLKRLSLFPPPPSLEIGIQSLPNHRHTVLKLLFYWPDHTSVPSTLGTEGLQIMKVRTRDFPFSHSHQLGDSDAKLQLLPYDNHCVMIYHCCFWSCHRLRSVVNYPGKLSHRPIAQELQELG